MTKRTPDFRIANVHGLWKMAQWSDAKLTRLREHFWSLPPASVPVNARDTRDMISAIDYEISRRADATGWR